jgi:hypothetical protein
MPRAPRAPLTLDPAFRAKVCEVLTAHRGQGNVYSGGSGVPCYVWVTGPSNRTGTQVRSLLGGYDLDLAGGKVYAALRAAGCTEVSINID